MGYSQLWRALMDLRCKYESAADDIDRIAKPRGARRPGAAHPAPGLGATSAALQQQSLPTFGQTNSSQQSGSTFGQQTNSNPPNKTSASFPPFGGSSGASNSGSHDLFGAQNTAFSFNSTPVNNPFNISAGAGQSSPAQTQGFQGSIFNFQAPSGNDKNDTVGTVKPLFATGAPTLNSQENAALQNPTQPTSNGFTWPSPQEQQKQPSSNFFQQPTTSQSQSSSVFSQIQNKPKEPTVGIFSNIQPPAMQRTEDETKQKTTDVFAPLHNPEAKAAGNPFAASIASFQEDQKKKSSSNVFSNFNPQPTQNSSASDATPANLAQSQTDSLSSSIGDSMQTSPDSTPRKEFQAQSTPFSLMNQSASQPQTSVFNPPDAQPIGGSLFDRISKPPAQSAGSSNGDAASASHDRLLPSEPIQRNPESLANPFSNIKTPNPSQTSMLSEPQRNVIPEMPSKPDLLRFPRDWRTVSDEEIEARNAAYDELVVRDPPAADIDYGPGNPPLCPTHFTAEDKRHVAVGYRLKQLDLGMYRYLKSHPIRNLDHLRQFYECKKQAIIAAGDGPLESNVGDQRKQPGDTLLEAPQAKKQQPNASLATGGLTPFDKPSQDPIHTASRTEPNGTGQSLTNTNTKRKADEASDRDSRTIINDSGKRARGSDTAPKSQTSSLFSDILAAGSRNPFSDKPQGTSNDAVQGMDTIRSQAPAMKTFSNTINSNDTQGSSVFQPRMTSVDPSTTQAPPSPFKPAIAAPAFSNTSTATSIKPGLGSITPAASPAPSPFSINPGATPVVPASLPAVAAVPAFKPPTFGTGAPTNFMSQFGDSAKRSEEEAKKKRKAEDYDSEEEDEASWERRDAEEQQMKRQKIEEAAKAAQRFVPKFGTTKNSAKPGPAHVPKSPVKSVFDQTRPAFGNAEVVPEDKGSKAVASTNPFGLPSNPSQQLGQSLFNRISKPDQDLTSKPAAIGSDANPQGDHTWRNNSPIKFGSDTSSTSGPTLNVTSASPSKEPFTGLFGGPNPPAPTDMPSKPSSSGFSFQQSTTSGNHVGFGFSQVKPAINALAPPLDNTSRATSPAATTGESANESNAEGADEPEENQNQLDLMSERAGEENEEVLLEIKTKGLQYVPETKAWMSRGVGPLRVLMHRETRKPRIVLRADPSGRVVINSGFVKEGNYENIGCKTIAAPIIADGKLGLWRLRVGNDKDLKKLWETLDENKKFA